MALLITVCAGLLWTRLGAEDLVLEGQTQKATLLELYSSEGCSSCPPAERWVSQLKDDPRLWKEIVPVVFHVDYWDGLGWPDRFARKAYTQRQYDYQMRWNAPNVYTPEFIADGREWRRTLSGGGLPLGKEEVGPLQVVVHPEGWSVKVKYTPTVVKTGQRLKVNVAWLGMGIDSDVRGGENSGRKLTHDFVVLDFQSKVVSMEGKSVVAEEFFASPVAEVHRPGAIAAWVSREDGAVIQATGGAVK